MISLPRINSPQDEEIKTLAMENCKSLLYVAILLLKIKGYIFTQVANIAEKYLRVSTERQLLNFVSLII